MKKTKKIQCVGIIHARGGSRRIPLKALKRLGRYPLIAYMTMAACASRLDRVILSTDHKGIARAGKRYGAQVPFLRPAALAEDVPSELVTQHAVKWLEEHEHVTPEVIVTLQPTTPFCQARDINACIRKLIKTGADTVTTVSAISERPEWMFSMSKDGRLDAYTGKRIKGERGVMQSLPDLYVPNGAVYACTYKTVMKDGVIYGKDVRGVVMSLERSVDIDEPIDLDIARALIRNHKDLVPLYPKKQEKR